MERKGGILLFKLIYDSMDKPREHFSKRNRTDTKRKISHYLTYIYNQKVKYIEPKSRTVVSEGWEMG
jgi:hypothetical protein